MATISQKQFKDRLCLALIAAGACLIIAGYLTEKNFQYSLQDYDGIEFGSYGFYLAQIPEPEEVPGQKRIVLLGNSVYQYSGIPRQMQKIADWEGLALSISNMGQVSASIYDHLLQSAKIVHRHPDLVVISLISESFIGDLRFKTDSHQVAFDTDVLSVTAPSFYRRYFDLNTGFSSALSSLFRIKRLDTILRWKCEARELFPAWFLKKISYPHLNILQERSDRGDIFKFFKAPEGEAFSEDEQRRVLEELIAVYQKAEVPLLFILQERAPDGAADLHAFMQPFADEEAGIYLADFRSYWDKPKYRDMFHPKDKELKAYATRHLMAVQNVLNKQKESRP